MTERDRKDVPHADECRREAVAETPTDRVERKQKESDALDEALEETFPTSDPVSPFVPAIPTEPVTDEEVRVRRSSCAHARCSCQVVAPAVWCSDLCRDAQQGYDPNHAAGCACGHTECEQLRPHATA
jgi:hypothetical protein